MCPNSIDFLASTFSLSWTPYFSLRYSSASSLSRISVLNATPVALSTNIVSSPIGDSSMNSSDKFPPIAPLSAATGFAFSPNISNISKYAFLIFWYVLAHSSAFKSKLYASIIGNVFPLNKYPLVRISFLYFSPIWYSVTGKFLYELILPLTKSVTASSAVGAITKSPLSVLTESITPSSIYLESLPDSSQSFAGCNVGSNISIQPYLSRTPLITLSTFSLNFNGTLLYA